MKASSTMMIPLDVKDEKKEKKPARLTAEEIMKGDLDAVPGKGQWQKLVEQVSRDKAMVGKYLISWALIGRQVNRWYQPLLSNTTAATFEEWRKERESIRPGEILLPWDALQMFATYVERRSKEERGNGVTNNTTELTWEV